MIAHCLNFLLPCPLQQNDDGKSSNRTYHITKHTLSLLALALVLCGCDTRSISDSGYRHPYGWRQSDNPLYFGELTEFDILGAAPRQDATEANITKALQAAATPKLKRGDKVILIQSGAEFPDNSMQDEIARYFAAAPFSGVPPADKSGLAESLRLRAAQGGYPYIGCYWGILESGQVDSKGKVVSWVPIVGTFVPDQKEQMRIRLKAILVDVATGGWKMLTPEAQSDAGLNNVWTRESNDQKLVLALKEKGYKSLVADLVKE